MRLNLLKTAGEAVVLAAMSVLPVAAQRIQVEIGRSATAIPVCMSVVPAKIEGNVDIRALVKEAICKGSGEMLAEYTYVLKYVRRGMSLREESMVYEVYMPTLKNGTRGQGVMLLTSRDGKPVPPRELEKDRLRAGQQLEKEENKIAAAKTSESQITSVPTTGMLPLGMYPRITAGAQIFGNGGAVLDIPTFLTTCELTLVRREQRAGRERLVLSFKPPRNFLVDSTEAYITQLNGEVWIDARDRIVTRLVGWPANAPSGNEQNAATLTSDKPPAVYVEMVRLPTGVWLPALARINGLDYPRLFNLVAYDSTLTYTDYKRFSTEIKEVKVGTPN
jgi:hypothetical protein